ncbi:MAG: FAD-dependent oxidoreductase [Acidobacteriota bacterium]
MGRRTTVKPYEIPYRVLLPKRAEAENLLVPVCVSSSHVAYSTLRMEPVYQMLGHAAGLAAMLSLQQGVPPHALDMEKLKDRLQQQGQILAARPFNERWP